MFDGRVFGVGFNKTGTTTLKRCFQAFGIEPIAPNARLRVEHKISRAIFERGDYEPALECAERFRGFEDRPWNVWEMYQHLDRRFPDSRFILTVRDPEEWWRSTERWITVTKPGMSARYRQHLRARSLAKDDMLAGYHRYNREVQEYFAGTGRLLVIDFAAGDGWEPLAEFLGADVPDEPFPHANQQHYDGRDGGRQTRKKLRRLQRKLSLRRTKRRLLVETKPCRSCGEPVPLRAPDQPRRTSAIAPVRRAVLEWQNRKPGGFGDPTPAPERAAGIRRDQPDLGVDDLAVVTAYFNPCGYGSRKANYERFRDRIRQTGVPLLTVELATGDARHELEGPEGSILRLRSPDVLWHKERLLNLGIRELLSRGFRKIAWLDADILIQDPEAWPWLVADELERSALCQVFGTVRIEDGQRSRLGVSTVRYAQESRGLLAQRLLPPSRRRPFGFPMGCPGFGWAARAEVLRQVELYDRSVLGGGDKLMMAASLAPGTEEPQAVRKATASPLQRCRACGLRDVAPHYLNDYMEWAERWGKAVDSRVGFAPAEIVSLGHGEARQRSYAKRREILIHHRFEPDRDLAEGPDGGWRWASEKPALHREVADYFISRNEDG